MALSGSLQKLGAWLVSRNSWITVEKVEVVPGSWAIVLKIDGFYFSEEDAEGMRDYWEDLLKTNWTLVRGVPFSRLGVAPQS